MDMIANRTMERVDMLDRKAFQNSYLHEKTNESAYFVGNYTSGSYVYCGTEGDTVFTLVLKVQ